MDSWPTNRIINQPCSKTIMTTISSDATYSLTNTSTTIRSSTNMITSILTIGHHVTRQNKIPTHTPIISETKKNLPPYTSWRHFENLLPSPHPKTTLPSKTSNQPSTAASKPNTKYSTTSPTNQTTPPSRHLSFTFYLIPNCLNYISNLNFPKNLAKFYPEIQRNTDLSITKIVNKNKNKITKHLQIPNPDSHQENTHLHLFTYFLRATPP